MKFTTSLALLLTAALSFATVACEPTPTEVVVVPAVPAKPPAPEPTAARAMQRSQARWEKGMKGDWIAAYDFLVPEGKREQPLARFLGSMQMHKYENMKVLEVIDVKDGTAYLRVGGLWTPLAPELARVKLEPGQTLTQELQMIEIWRWVEGDWCFVRPQRDTEFFAEHPELLKKSTPPETPKAGETPK